MSGRSLGFVVVAAFAAVAPAGRASHGDETSLAANALPEADRDAANVAAAIERTLDVIDLILEHHVDPPTRPEMLRRIAEMLRRRVDSEAPPPLGNDAATCTDRDRSRRFLAALGAELAPAIAAGNIAEAQAPKAESTTSPTRRRRGAPGGTKVHISLDDFLQEALSALASGRIELMDTKELKVQEQFQANRYVGIGVALGSEDDYAAFNLVISNGPAAKAGIVEGDRIEAIDGQSMKRVKLTEVVDRLRGPEGTIVTIVVRQPGANDSRTFPVTRGLIPRDTVNGWDYVEGRSRFRVSPTSSIAYVRIGEIGGSTVEELRQVERQLTAEEVKALVMDLRDTYGGAHHFAALLADALLDGGTIGRIRARTRTHEYVADRDCLFRGWPLVVLVNEGTSNTAEWLAAALQDNRRALIAGEATPGEGYAYASVPFPDGKQSLRLATGILERPSGKPLVRPTPDSLNEQRQPGSSPAWGVAPDFVVPSKPQFVRIAGNLSIRTLSDGPDDPGVKKACELLQAALDAPLRLAPSRLPDASALKN